MTRHPWMLLGIASTFLVGCDSPQRTFPVNGRVVFKDGTPARFGAIETLSVEERVNARGTIGPDGTFSLTTYEKNDGAVPGEHRVAIIQAATVPLAISASTSTRHTHGRDLAARYRSFATSGLAFTVVPDSVNYVTLEVEDAADQARSGR
jgi:hypothetical protein